MSDSPGELTNPDFICRLESLYLLARRVLGGTLQADRKSKRKGAGITFSTEDEGTIDFHVAEEIQAGLERTA